MRYTKRQRKEKAIREQQDWILARGGSRYGYLVHYRNEILSGQWTASEVAGIYDADRQRLFDIVTGRVKV